VRPRFLAPMIGALIAFAVVPTTMPACSLGQGTGAISGTLNVDDCWAGKFALHPDFFAGVPYRDSLELRIQSGGDYESFSDGISILIDNVHTVRGDRGPGFLNQPLIVSLPVGVSPPGVPFKANPTPAAVHMSLYLQTTCRTQDVALYAMAEVSLPCDELDAGDLSARCAAANGGADGGAPPVASAGTAQSTITFVHLFNGNQEEENAAEKLTEASFDVYLADPREICPGGLGPPPRCRGHLKTEGTFKFYFERGRPGQPFP
jgi:hypothetical protein